MTEEFVSEPIAPDAGTFDTAAMGTGLPGLPTGFTWRSTHVEVGGLVERWKQSGPERGRADGERYLRRHYFRLAMVDGSLWTVYFVRQAPPGGSPRTRWFLYARQAPPPPGAQPQ